MKRRKNSVEEEFDELSLLLTQVLVRAIAIGFIVVLVATILIARWLLTWIIIQEINALLVAFFLSSMAYSLLYWIAMEKFISTRVQRIAKRIHENLLERFQSNNKLELYHYERDLRNTYQNKR